MDMQSSPSIAALRTALDVPEGTLIGHHHRVLIERTRGLIHTVKFVSKPEPGTCVAFAFGLSNDPAYKATVRDSNGKVFVGKRFVEWMMRNPLQEIDPSKIVADWAETLAIVTSMLLIIPVWTVLVNFFGTVRGRWDGFGRNLPAKFLIMGSLMYLAGCFQGSVEALRSIQQPTHFSDFVISHSHLTVFGTFVVWAMGGLVYVWPRVCGRELWSFALGNWASNSGFPKDPSGVSSPCSCTRPRCSSSIAIGPAEQQAMAA